MKSPLLTGVAGLVLLSAAHSATAQGAADPVFAAVREACVATGAEPDGVKKVTDRGGWRDGDATGQTLDGFAVDDKLTRARRIGPSDLKLFAWHGKNAKGIIAEECSVLASKTNFAAIESATAASLGFQPQQSSPTKAVFQYSGPLDAPRPLDRAQFDEAASNGGVKILTLTDEAGAGVLIGLLRIQK